MLQGREQPHTAHTERLGRFRAGETWKGAGCTWRLRTAGDTSGHICGLEKSCGMWERGQHFCATLARLSVVEPGRESHRNLMACITDGRVPG